MNQAEDLFQAFKKGCFPSGGPEKELRMAFFNGIAVGMKVITQATELSNDEMREFLVTFHAQLGAKFDELRIDPPKVNLKLVPKPLVKVTASIEGQPIPDK